MKRSEIALLILIIAISLVAAYFIAQAVIGNRASDPVQVETAEPISAEVTAPSTEVFNDDAINPTVPVRIGGNNNQQPF